MLLRARFCTGKKNRAAAWRGRGLCMCSIMGAVAAPHNLVGGLIRNRVASPAIPHSSRQEWGLFRCQSEAGWMAPAVPPVARELGSPLQMSTACLAESSVFVNGLASCVDASAHDPDSYAHNHAMSCDLSVHTCTHNMLQLLCQHPVPMQAHARVASVQGGHCCI